MSTYRSFFGVALAAWVLTGCGAAVYQPSKTTGFELDHATEINDDDVRKAFDARPQMRDTVQVAYYSFDPTKSVDIETMLRALPGVSGTYRIPSLMATGQKRFEERHAWDPPVPFSMKKLRLLAARAHCDLLVVFDYGNKVETSANGLAAFGILVIPTLFLPMFDVTTNSAMDSYLMDTRNGYLYAHVDAQKETLESFVTIYSSSGDRRVKEQWPRLLADTTTAVRRALEGERAHRTAPVRTVEAAPPSPSLDGKESPTAPTPK